MDHLQQAKHAIERACIATDSANLERATVEAQLATAHALIAIAEHINTSTIAQERHELTDLYALPSV